MSYIRTSESTSPAIASQYFNSGSTGMNGAVTLNAPQCIGNPTDTAGFIAFKRPQSNPERDYFLPGQVKPWVVERVYDYTGTTGINGSTINCYVAGA